MSSIAFKIQKAVGREFETAMIPVLEKAGMRVIDVDHWAYKHKRGRDIIVEVKGYRNSLELKYDRISEKTGRVCIDLDSLKHTDSAIWVFGLPRGPEIDVYAVKTSDLAPYVYQYIKDHPGALQRVGEFKQECAFISKPVFTSLPFISKFKTINLN